MPARRAAAGVGAALAAAVLLASCAGAAPGDAGPSGPTGPTGATGPTGPTGPAAWTRLGEASAGGLDLALLTDRPLGTGLTLLAVSVAGPGGAPAADARVRLSVSRASPGGVVTAPGLGEPAPGADGLHRWLVAIPAAATAAEGWEVAAAVSRPGEAEATAAFGRLAALERWLAAPFDVAGERWLLAVRFDGPLVAGPNPFSASLHRSADGGASWSPVADAVMAVTPFMPSMGHGSTGSAAPTPTGTAGEYRGALAFSMAGDWETTFAVAWRGAEVGRPVVTVYF